MQNTNLLHEALEADLTYVPSKRFKNWKPSKFVLPQSPVHDPLAAIFIKGHATLNNKSFVLSKEQEIDCFVQLNYLKRKCQNLVAKYNKNRFVKNDIESTFSQIKQILEVIVRANFAVLFQWAYCKTIYKHCGALNLIADAMAPMMKCIKRFDVDRGYKFSTFFVKFMRTSFSDTNDRMNRESNHRKTENIDHSHYQIGASYNLVDSVCKKDIYESVFVKNNAGLDDRELFIIHSYYADEQTLEQLGKQLDVSKERVRQIRVEAEQKIKAILV